MKPKAIFLPLFDESTHVVRNVVEQVFREADVEPMRLEQGIPPGARLTYAIKDSLQKSDLVVADVSSQRPDTILFELGYLDALRKPCVLLINAESDSEIPFNLVGNQFIAYDPGDLDAFTRRLKQFVQAHFERLKDAV